MKYDHGPMPSLHELPVVARVVEATDNFCRRRLVLERLHDDLQHGDRRSSGPSTRNRRLPRTKSSWLSTVQPGKPPASQSVTARICSGVARGCIGVLQAHGRRIGGRDDLRDPWGQPSSDPGKSDTETRDLALGGGGAPSRPGQAQSSSEVRPSRIAYIVESATLWMPSSRMTLRRVSRHGGRGVVERLPIGEKLSRKMCTCRSLPFQNRAARR